MREFLAQYSTPMGNSVILFLAFSYAHAKLKAARMVSPAELLDVVEAGK